MGVLVGNPKSTRTRNTRPKKEKHHVAKKGKKKNPSGSSSTTRGMIKRLSSWGMSALELIVAKVGVDIITQNVLPTSWRVSPYMGPLAKLGVGLALALGAGYIKPLAKYSETIAIGATISAFQTSGLEDKILPPLAFNLLGDAYYLGELDHRRLIAIAPLVQRRANAGVSGASAGAGVSGRAGVSELDRRTVYRRGLPA